MTVEKIPLYDLHDRLLGWSMYVVFGQVDNQVLADWATMERLGRTGDWSAESQQWVAWARNQLPNRQDRGVEVSANLRDRESYVWFFRPCPFDHLETM